MVIIPVDVVAPGARIVQDEELASLARASRTAAGLSQRQAAEAFGVAQPSVAKAEMGGTSALRALRIRMIEALGTDRVSGPYWLLTPTDEDSP